MAQAINGRRIDPVDAEVQRLVNRRDRIVIVLRSPGKRPISAADGPRTEANRRELHIRIAKLFLLHLSVLTDDVYLVFKRSWGYGSPGKGYSTRNRGKANVGC